MFITKLPSTKKKSICVVFNQNMSDWFTLKQIHIALRDGLIGITKRREGRIGWQKKVMLIDTPCPWGVVCGHSLYQILMNESLFKNCRSTRMGRMQQTPTAKPVGLLCLSVSLPSYFRLPLLYLVCLYMSWYQNSLSWSQWQIMYLSDLFQWKQYFRCCNKIPLKVKKYCMEELKAKHSDVDRTALLLLYYTLFQLIH